MSKIIESLIHQALRESTLNGTTDLCYRPEGCTNFVSKDVIARFAKLLIEDMIQFTEEYIDGCYSARNPPTVSEAVEMMKIYSTVVNF